MTKLGRLPKEMLVVICDSRKALLLRNAGSEIKPALEVVEHLENAEDDRGVRMSDRPGRRYDAGGGGAAFHPRSAMEEPDLSREIAASFAEQLVDHLSRRHRENAMEEVLIAAPPAFLGILRDSMPEHLAALVTAEVPKHLTEARVDEIASSLVEKW